jgi:hypothetical protein
MAWCGAGDIFPRFAPRAQHKEGPKAVAFGTEQALGVEEQGAIRFMAWCGAGDIFPRFAPRAQHKEGPKALAFGTEQALGVEGQGAPVR